MKIVMHVSTTSGAKPGDTVEFPDSVASDLVTKGFATEVPPRKRKAPKATAEGDESDKKEG